MARAHRVVCALTVIVAFAVQAAAQAPPPEEAGILALQAGDFDKAASLFADALRQNPRNPTLHMGAGVAARLRGRPAEARKFLTRALELAPTFVAAAALLGEVAYEQGDTDFAIRLYEKTLKTAPANREMRDRLQLWRDDAAKERLVSGPFSITFDGPAEGRLAQHASGVLESAYWRIAGALGAYPSQPIEIVFYTLERFRDLTGAPEWAIGAFDTRIRIPVQGALANPATFDRVLTHELAHAMIAGVAPSGVPAWLHEGLATYFETGEVSRATARLKAARTLIPLAQLQNGFTRFDARTARLAYDESVVAAGLLIERLGPDLALLLHDLDQGNDLSLALTRLGIGDGDLDRGLARLAR
jgi:tetratricopeptide (TPR) repeat protein